MKHLERTRLHVIRFAALAGFGLLLAACAGGSDSSQPLDQSSWVLTELDGGAVAPTAPASIIFGATAGTEAGEAFGSTGCNTFKGRYQTDGDAISIGPLITTLAGCNNPAAQPQEGRYLITLETAETYTVSGDILALANAKGEITARFERLEANIELTAWKAVSINNGQGGVQSALQRTPVTATFNDIGLVSGLGGCNNFSTAYRIGEEYDVAEGGTIQFAGIAAGNKECDPDVTEQEDAYFAALKNSGRWLMTGLTLELRSADGALQVSFVRIAGG